MRLLSILTGLLFLSIQLTAQVPATHIKKVSVSLVSVDPTNNTQPWTVTHIQSVLEQVNILYQNVSYGKTRLDVTVFPWITYTNTNTTSCPHIAIRSFATATNKLDGSWDPKITAFPLLKLCFFNGQAGICGPNVSINGTDSVGTYMHEIGHALCLRHAHACDTIGDVCNNIESGDGFSVMGHHSAQLSTHDKIFMGYFDAINMPFTQQANVNGDYQLGAFEIYSLDLPKAIRVLASDGLEDPAKRPLWYAIEKRTDGMIIRSYRSGDRDSNFLLDLDRSSDIDYILDINQIYESNKSGVNLSIKNLDGSRIRIEFGGVTIPSSPVVKGII